MIVPDKLRRVLKWGGYPLFALAVFNFSLYVTLPRDRIREKLQHAVSDWLEMEVTATDFGLTMLTGPGVTAKGIMLKTRPVVPTEKPVRYAIDDITVHFDVYQLLRGFAGTSFRAHLSGGKVSGRFRSVPEEGVLAIDTSGLSLGAFPTLPQAIGLAGIPLEGTLDLSLDVTTPKNLIPAAEGSFTVTCDNLTVGDGKAKLALPGTSGGLTLPKVKLGRVTGSAVIAKGRVTLREFHAHSPDLDLELEGYIDLHDPLAVSTLHLYLKVKPSDALLKREPSLEAMVSMAGASAKRSDNFYGLTISGSSSAPLVIPSKDPPIGVGGHSLPSLPTVPRASAGAPGVPTGARPSVTAPPPALEYLPPSGPSSPPPQDSPPSVPAPPPPSYAPPPAQVASPNSVPPPPMRSAAMPLRQIPGAAVNVDRGEHDRAGDRAEHGDHAAAEGDDKGEAAGEQ